jgi:hypothetical protein
MRLLGLGNGKLHTEEPEVFLQVKDVGQLHG